jgi:hypothetical protein
MKIDHDSLISITYNPIIAFPKLFVWSMKKVRGYIKE